MIAAQGFFTFLAPCHLPLLPVLMMLFSGTGSGKKTRCFINTLSFTLGITASFCAMGAIAGAMGSVVDLHDSNFDLYCGIVMIVLGALYSGLLPVKMPHMSWTPKLKMGMSTAACCVFGALFSLSFIPCSGALWGTAMLSAANTGSLIGGIGMLLIYSLGVCVPFLVVALFMDKLGNTIQFVKRHAKAMNIAAGLLLVLFGILMATGVMHQMIHGHGH